MSPPVRAAVSSQSPPEDLLQIKTFSVIILVSQKKTKPEKKLSPPLQNNRALSPSAAPPPPVSWRKLNQLKIKQTPSSSKSMTLKPPNTKSLASPPERHKSSFLGRCGTSLALATRDSSLILYITARPVLTLESDKLRDSGSFSKPLASGF